MELNKNNINPNQFQQYGKSCNQLGSLIESCVKITKRIIYGSIKNNVLVVKYFNFIVCQTVHLINRRPVAFKGALRDKDMEMPQAITPEGLIRGYNSISINLVAELHNNIELEKEWLDKDELLN